MGRHGQGSWRHSPLALVTVLVLGACASTQEPSPTTPGARMSEAEAIAAAKQNPIAHPEPRPQYPAQAPPAIPEPPRASAPPPMAAKVEASAAPLSSAPPPAAAPETPPATTTGPQTTIYSGVESSYPSPSPYYLWAPGYWSWYSGRYVWVEGAWIPRRSGFIYVSPRWTYTPYGWSFMPGGWASPGTSVVIYPVVRPREYANRYRNYHVRPTSRGHHHLRSHAGNDRRGAVAPRTRDPVDTRPAVRPSSPRSNMRGAASAPPRSTRSSRVPEHEAQRIRPSR